MPWVMWNCRSQKKQEKKNQSYVQIWHSTDLQDLCDRIDTCLLCDKRINVWSDAQKQSVTDKHEPEFIKIDFEKEFYCAGCIVYLWKWGVESRVFFDKCVNVVRERRKKRRERGDVPVIEEILVWNGAGVARRSIARIFIDPRKSGFFFRYCPSLVIHHFNILLCTIFVLLQVFSFSVAE